MNALAVAGRGGFGADVDVLPVAEHVVVANVIEVGALFIVGEHKAREGDADGSFACADAVSGRHDRFDEDRFGGGEVVDEFLGARFGHDLIQAFASHWVVSVWPVGVWHDQLAAILRFDDIFERLRVFTRLEAWLCYKSRRT